MGFLIGDADDESDDETLAPHAAAAKLAPASAVKSEAKGEDVAPLQPRSISPGVPIMAPRPGYAAPVSALALAPPEPALTPAPRRSTDQQGPQMAQMRAIPAPITVPGPFGSRSLNSPRSPHSPFTPPTVPSTPHPLPRPMTPITPAFALPPQKAVTRDIKFSETPILRGNSEETLIPKRGQRGDDFWRRFSMVVKVEDSKRHEQRYVSSSKGRYGMLIRG